MFEEFNFYNIDDANHIDNKQVLAKKKLVSIIGARKDEVFFSRQLEIWIEDEYFHWITNRALRELAEEKRVNCEERSLKTGGRIHLYWNHGNRYYKRRAKEVVRIVEEYSCSNITEAVGYHAELLVIEAFARFGFKLEGRDSNSYKGKTWKKSDHNLDIIYTKEELAYGVEVKNTLGYMDKNELYKKLDLCDYLGIRAVFVVRMLPKSWINEINKRGGFALILKYQIYPLTLRSLVKRIKTELNLPVDCPKRIEDGTMVRLLNWHENNVKKNKNSQR